MQGRDLTRGSVPRLLVVLALPVFGSFVLQSLYALADLYFIGYLGGPAVAGLGISINSFFLVIALGYVVGSGGLALISQAYGRGDLAQATAVFRQVFWLILILGSAFWLAGWLGAETYFSWFTDNAAVRAAGLEYFRIYSATFLIQSTLMVFGSCWRAIGDFIRPTLLMGGNVLLNLALDPLLIFGAGPLPALGMAGAAWATVISQGAALVLYLVWIWRGNGVLVARGLVRPHWGTLLRIIRIGVPAGAQMVLAALALGLSYRAVRPFGAEASAAVGLGFRILQSALYPAVAIGTATAAMTGQNHGARLGGRVRATLGWGLVLALSVILAEIVILLSAPRWWAAQFVSEPGVIEVTGLYMEIAGLAHPLIAFGLIITFASVAVGRTGLPLVAVATRTGIYTGLLFAVSTWAAAWLEGVFWSHTVSLVVEAALMALIGLRLVQRSYPAPPSAA